MCRIVIYYPGKCKVPVGLEDRRIPSGAFSASSSYNSKHGPDRARLNQVAGRGRTGAWVAQRKNARQWLQVTCCASIFILICRYLKIFEAVMHGFRACLLSKKIVWCYLVLD